MTSARRICEEDAHEILELLVVGGCVVAGLVGVSAYVSQDPGPKWALGMMIVATAGAVILPRMLNLLEARGRNAREDP